MKRRQILTGLSPRFFRGLSLTLIGMILEDWYGRLSLMQGLVLFV